MIMASNNQSFEDVVADKLIEYHHDLRCKKIRDLFSHKTYFDILKKKYDENTHSAFIAWLLEGRDLNLAKDDAPIKTFLDLLIEKSKNDKVGSQRIQKKLKQAVLTRTVDIEMKEVSTEKVIKDLSSINESQDRIDIYLEAQATIEEKDEYLLQIFIENKIGSTEGLPKTPSKKKSKTASQSYLDYCKQYQTQRYYSACSAFFEPKSKYAKQTKFLNKSKKKNGKVLQLFVYLTTSDATGPKCDQYIHINYQDLYNRVLSPLLMECDLSTTCYSLIKEYALTLTLPPANKSDRRQILAIPYGGEEEQLLRSFWDDHQDLIKYAADNSVKFNINKDTTGSSKRGRKSRQDNAASLLEKFWKVNSDVIMAACYLRLFDENISRDTFDEINYYLSNLTPGWDRYMYRYKVNKKFKVSKSLLKRNLVHEIVEILLNVKNVKLAEFHPLKLDDDGQKTFSFIEKQDVLVNVFRNNPSALEARYFDPFDIDGVKYRLSNQWGAGIIFNAFIDKMAEFGFEIKQVAVNGTVKWDDNN